VIFGIGVDVLEAKRMAAMHARYGERIERHLLMPEEMAQYAQTKRKERYLAMRFAAKEAVVKAMGTGFAHGVWIRDVGIVQNEWGRPEVIYSARGDKVRRELGVGEAHVTLTDEAGLIVAVAVLMRAVAKPPRRRQATAKTMTKTTRMTKSRASAGSSRLGRSRRR
jgi:holo-[acyl-carrier protein] synthase